MSEQLTPEQRVAQLWRDIPWDTLEYGLDGQAGRMMISAIRAAETAIWKAAIDAAAGVCRDRAGRAFAKSLGAHPWGDGGQINESNVQAEADACADAVAALTPPGAVDAGGETGG